MTRLYINPINNLNHMSQKRVYTFGNGLAEGKADMRNLLGGKGANLAEMNLIWNNRKQTLRLFILQRR